MKHKSFKWFKLKLDRRVKTGNVWWTRTLYVKAQSKSSAKRLADERIARTKHGSFGILSADKFDGTLRWYNTQIQ